MTQSITPDTSTVFASATEVVSGTIDTTSPSTIVGTGFTLVRNSTGNVTVTFTNAFSSAPRVQLTAGNNANATVVLQADPTTSSFTLVRLAPSTGGNIDGRATFYATVPLGYTRIPRDYGIVTALPTAASTGDTCTYTDSLTSPTYYWELKYNGSDSGSYKWAVVGGGALYVQVTSNVTTTSGSFVSLGSDDIKITVPLAGDYDVITGCRSYNTVQGGNAYMDFTGGGHTATTNDANQSYCATTGAGPINSVQSREITATGVAASGTITAKYAVSGSTGNWQYRWMRAMPRRVG